MMGKRGEGTGAIQLGFVGVNGGLVVVGKKSEAKAFN